MNVIMLGATKGIGRALARLMYERGDRLALLGRDHADLLRTASDLMLRWPGRSEVEAATCDLERPDTFDASLSQVRSALGTIDAVVVTAGVFEPQEALEANPERARQLLAVDFTNTIAFCERARGMLLSGGGGTLCVVSSVAGDRGRSSVVIYGAAKAGLSSYLEGLDHRFRKDGLVTICVKPGFVKTSMTQGLKPPPFATTPEMVARRMLLAIDRGWPEVYAPAIWRLVMTIVKSMPRVLMRRMTF